jgi:pimeloyl-ACP methyl ester carboxylesterase
MRGGELFYYDSESDNNIINNNINKQTIVLIHGLGDEADTWRHIFPLLTGAGYRVIAPDLPGFGRSNWTGRISVRGHCGAVIRLLAATRAASAKQPAALVGSSLGAGIAEMAACRRPGLIKALVLIDGCLPFRSRGSGLFFLGMPIIGTSWYRSFRSDHEAAWKSLYPYYSDLDGMSAADRDFLRERVIARVESANQERGYLATLRSMNTFSFFDKKNLSRKIKTFAGKIAILWGEKDHVFPPKRAAVFRGLRPDAGFTFINGAGHLPHQEKPDATAAEIIRFLKEE